LVEVNVAAGNEVFALTDEQIVGMESEPFVSSAGPANPPAAKPEADRGHESQVTSQDPPAWLAAQMAEAGSAEEAKEFWEGKQRAEKEAIAYREVFATPEEARALKELYPGGLNEAKTTAERARTLDEFDSAYYRGDAAARTALAQRMLTEDPAAFREMVEAGMRLLGAVGNAVPASRQDAGATSPGADEKSAGMTLRPRSGQEASATEEVVRGYAEFERAANSELEKSVGATITHAMEQALPNLRQRSSRGEDGGVNPPLQERLAGAVRDEVEAGLKSDRQLSDQISRILAGRRFDDAARAQVVRLIDARAQQLVPGAVKRVVGAWTQATLAARPKRESAASAEFERGEERSHVQDPPTPLRASRQVGNPVQSQAKPQSSRDEMEILSPAPRPRRFDYSRFTDEQILGL
jgi:hypothetical protein